jgi:hypothetical protein
MAMGPVVVSLRDDFLEMLKGIDGESGGRGKREMWLPCDNSPRKIPYYRLNQSTLVIKQ